MLRALVPERVVTPELYVSHFFKKPLSPGGVYPTLYLTRDQFLSIETPKNSRRFVIVRDLRDTLVSGYFSIRYSHPLLDGTLALWRAKLNTLTVEEGLLFLMDEWLPKSANIQSSWVNSEEQIIRYEDLLSQDLTILESLLIDHCGLNISTENIKCVVEKNRFKRLSAGRKNGEEDLLSHRRKGVAGDWKNHFTSLVTERFESRYGKLLTTMGYERITL